jgi:peptidoglycan hydrolase-like protein with peptidoglycan-binding domain
MNRGDMGATELARVTSPNLGVSNTIPNSIQQVSLRMPCYCGYKLREGDSDKAGKWAGEARGGSGDWVRQLQSDLIDFGIYKNGLIVEKKIPQPDKIVKNKKTGKTEKIKQPDQVEWQRVTLVANGVFDEVTTAALKLFQWHAGKIVLRQLADNQVSVGITYSGNVDGVMSDEVCSEMKVWREKNYKIVRPALKEAHIKVDAEKFRQLYESNPRMISS